VAAGLLVLTTVTASVWTFFALSRLSGIVTDTVRQSESVTAVTSRLAGALEREDDAVLLILAGDDRGSQVLARERTVVDSAVADLFNVLEPDDERELATPLKSELSAYREAADGVISLAFEREALVRYHQTAHHLPPSAISQLDTVSISVSDTGPGIPTAFRSRVFDKFFRLEHHHAEARPAARGAGIGLYMCRQIVELHGGDISCGSGTNDRGTRITVRLPAKSLSDVPVVKDSATYVT
jgi:hypothetical protein